MIRKTSWGFVIRRPFNEEELKLFFGNSFTIGNEKKGISEESVKEILVCGSVWHVVGETYANAEKDKEIATYVSGLMKGLLKDFGEKIIYSNILMSVFLNKDEFALKNKISEISLDKVVRVLEFPKGKVDTGVINYQYNVTGFDVVEFAGKEIRPEIERAAVVKDMTERTRD